MASPIFAPCKKSVSPVVVQLGRMLLQAAANYPVETYLCLAAHLCHHFTKGDIKDFGAVYNFGNGLDAITMEIDNVNVDALAKIS